MGSLSKGTTAPAEAARVGVFGYGELGATALETLILLGARVVALTVPSNRSGPDFELIRAVAARLGIPVLIQPPSSKIEPFAAALRAVKPDVILVWSYSMILPPAVLEVPRLGCVNVHGGLLPNYRGGHVMHWAIINGESETGVTLHYMDEAVDRGPIIAQAHVPIAWEDDALTVRAKLRSAGMELLRTWWPAIAAGTAPRIPQDHTQARYYRLRTPDDGLIDWSAPATRIYNLVRALVAPWPGAFTFFRGQRVVMRHVAVAKESLGPSRPGLISSVGEEGMRVGTGEGDLVVLELEVDGKLAGPDEWRALGIAPGEQFGS